GAKWVMPHRAGGCAINFLSARRALVSRIFRRKASRQYRLGNAPGGDKTGFLPKRFRSWDISQDSGGGQGVRSRVSPPFSLLFCQYIETSRIGPHSAGMFDVGSIETRLRSSEQPKTSACLRTENSRSWRGSISNWPLGGSLPKSAQAG